MSALGLAYKHVKNTALRNLSVKSGRLLSKPLHVSIEPSKRCNAKCVMCPSWKIREDYLNYQEIINSLVHLRNWMGKNYYVSLAGGETLIYDGIFNIFSYCSTNNIASMITTNGICLNKPVLDKIIDSGLSYIAISLDSHIASVHDSIRGHDGLFQKVIDSIYYLKSKCNIPIGISSVLMKPNAETFPETVDFFLKLPIDRFIFQPIQIWDGAKNYSAWNQSDLWIQDSALLSTIAESLYRKKQLDKRIFNSEQDIKDLEIYFADPMGLAASQKRKCTLGYEKICIDYKGNIF